MTPRDRAKGLSGDARSLAQGRITLADFTRRAEAAFEAAVIDVVHGARTAADKLPESDAATRLGELLDALEEKPIDRVG